MTDLPEKENIPPAEIRGQALPESEGLTKEVTAAGVSIHPTTIPIPQPVVQMGIQPGSANIPMPSAPVVLPLSDTQIAQGLGKSITNSWRWLAEWCLRKLKQAHIAIKYLHGRLVRVQA